MGIFSSSQFLGIFAGGSLGGLVNHHWGTSGVFLFSAAVVAIWLGIALRLPTPSFYTSRLLRLREHVLLNPSQLEADLLAVAGVKEVALAPDEQVAYLKVDKAQLDESALQQFAASEETANVLA
jgi:MFS family permease